MEEFYRRKYLNPSYNRVSTYLQSLQKDKTVGDLRKQLQDCKQMQGKFEDLCLEISKIEKQNKRLEGDHSQIQTDYLQRIKQNKSSITDLKRIIGQFRDGVDEKTQLISTIEEENDKLLQELKGVRKQAEENHKQKCGVEIKLCEQEKTIDQFQKNLNDWSKKCLEFKQQNQLKSAKLEENYRQLKREKQFLKDEELECEDHRKELQILIQKRKEFEAKSIASKSKFQAAHAELQFQQRECQKIRQIQQELESAVDKKANQGLQADRDLKKTLAKNKEYCLKIRTNQDILMQSTKHLQKDQVYLQKIEMKQVELKKGNQRLEEILKNLNQILADEQQSYGRIIGHMKESILQDEKAIFNLTKQACLLENIIS